MKHISVPFPMVGRLQLNCGKQLSHYRGGKLFDIRSAAVTLTSGQISVAAYASDLAYLSSID